MCYSSADRNQVFPLGAVRNLLGVCPLIVTYSVSVFMEFFFLIHIFSCVSHADCLPYSKSEVKSTFSYFKHNTSVPQFNEIPLA